MRPCRSNNMKTFYITKWAFTKGIIVRDCDIFEEGTKQYATSNKIFVLIDKDAFESEQSARFRVIDLINAKLKSLDKAKIKLLKLKQTLE